MGSDQSPLSRRPGTNGCIRLESRERRWSQYLPTTSVNMSEAMRSRGVLQTSAPTWRTTCRPSQKKLRTSPTCLPPLARWSDSKGHNHACRVDMASTSPLTAHSRRACRTQQIFFEPACRATPLCGRFDVKRPSRPGTAYYTAPAGQSVEFRRTLHASVHLPPTISSILSWESVAVIPMLALSLKNQSLNSHTSCGKVLKGQTLRWKSRKSFCRRGL